MHVDRKNLRHWVLLLLSAALVFTAIPFRVFRNRRRKTVVFFYQMHGNAKPLAEYLQKHDKSIRIYYLAFPHYHRLYEGTHDLPTLSMLSLRDMIKVAQSDVIVTNYGALTLLYLARFTSIRFVDVFHGILLLKFMPPPYLTYLNHYDEVWVSSPYMKKIYAKKFGVTSKLVPTGYARTDKLVNRSYRGVKKKYSIPANKKVIMIAPTWKHGDPDRNVLPFGMSEREFIRYAKSLAKETGAFIIYRSHMINGASLSGADKASHMRAMPSNEYTDTEELLSMVDVLVTDWSSLAFDFLAVDRPVIFLDTKPPFVGEDITRRSNPEGRFGEIVKTREEFSAALTTYLKNPDAYLKKHRRRIARIKEQAYGPNADGKATERYYKRLKALL